MDEHSSSNSSLKIFNSLKGKLPDILADRPVNLAYLYGSIVDGRALPSSDADMALVLESNCSLSAYERMRLEFDIAAEVESRCHINKADVRSINEAPLTVQGMVVTEGVLLYSRDEEFRVEFEVYTRKLYFDFLPVQEMMRRSFFENVQKEGFLSGKTRQS